MGRAGRNVVTETPERHAALDWFGFGWDQRIDVAPFKSAVDFGVGIAGIGSDRFDIDPGDSFDFVHLDLDHLAFIRLSSRDLNVENDADFVIDSRVLLVSRLQSPIASVRRHCCVGIGRADLLVLTALAAFSLGLQILLGLVLAQHVLNVTLDQAAPAHIGADQRGIDVHNLSRGDLRLQAGLDRTLEDSPEPLFTPALADARQTRMMRQLFMQTVANEPTDGGDEGIKSKTTTRARVMGYYSEPESLALRDRNAFQTPSLASAIRARPAFVFGCAIRARPAFVPRGSRPSMAAFTSSGARNASEIVILTCRMLHLSRAGAGLMK
jgi:hypothetical protein